MAVSAPAYARDAVASLSGNEVRALNMVYEKCAALTSRDLGSTVVRIRESNDAVFVSVAAKTQAQAIFKVDKRTDQVSQHDAALTVGTPEVNLPGDEAKAISLTYGKWLSDATAAPASRSDLLSGSFSVKEQPILQNPSGKPGYYVTYLASRPREPAGGLGCRDFTNYRVDPASWQVFKQPKIC